VFATNYHILAPLARVWARLAFEQQTWGVSEPDQRAPQESQLGRWHATVENNRWQFGAGNRAPDERPVNPLGPDGGVLLAQLSADEFLVIGRGARISFSPIRQSGSHGWLFERVWNGDQTDFGLNFTADPKILHVRLATY
jgi:hypothetical protein